MQLFEKKPNTGIILLLAFFLYCNLSAYTATAKNDTLKSSVNNLYITSFKDSLFNITTFTLNKYNFFELSNADPGRRNHSMIFKPNEKTKFGIGINYKWLGIKATLFALPTPEKENQLYGKTAQFDLQAHMYMKKLVFDAYFQNYKGYYIENPLAFRPNWDMITYPKRKDIRSTAAGINFRYVFNNEKFSYKASFTQTERQEKSAGSWLLGASFSDIQIAGDSNLVAIPQNNYFDDTSKIKKANFVNIGISGGYIFTLKIKKYIFITASLNPGIAYQFGIIRTQKPEFNSKISKLSFYGQARFSAGYNGKEFYYGVSAVTENYTLSDQMKSSIKFTTGNLMVFLGKRINHKKIKKFW